MAKTVETSATGDSANTGMPKNLAPTRPAKVPGPDIVSQPRNPQNVGSRYGMNNFAGRSSTSSGEAVNSPLSLSIKSASEKGSDPVLDAIIAKGSAAMDVTLTGDVVTATEGVTGSQIRKIGTGNVADAYGMGSARTRQNSTHAAMAAKVPGAVDKTNRPSPATAIRKP